ncbi:MAG: gamma-glutamyl-gamma-aminobutyrate hydrolase family protein [Clostridia bacterium]|nr:gamma-glutamyl-gamma-aminobutyrate hydrolase family protein [Clostridia bacterium]
MKPKILIIGEDDFSKNIPHFVISCEYGKAVSKAGGLPIVALDAMNPEDYVKMCDGLLLTGGPDIHCGRYGEFYSEDSEFPYLCTNRENLEFQICKLFLKAKKPVFGIGRGMQILNVVLGGTLYRDITDEGNNLIHTAKVDIKSPKAHITYHKINVNTDTELSKVLKNEEVVNSCHHQAIKELGENFVVSAVSEDGYIEAIEHKQQNAFGVQWHPEHADETLDADGRIFDYFVSVCREGLV